MRQGRIDPIYAGGEIVAVRAAISLERGDLRAPLRIWQRRTRRGEVAEEKAEREEAAR